MRQREVREALKQTIARIDEMEKAVLEGQKDLGETLRAGLDKLGSSMENGFARIGRQCPPWPGMGRMQSQPPAS